MLEFLDLARFDLNALSQTMKSACVSIQMTNGFASALASSNVDMADRMKL
jgi:hypothetical protein